MSDLVLKKGNFAELATAMGMQGETSDKSKTGKKTSTLARLKLLSKQLIEGKTVVVDAGTFELELPGGTKIYQADPTIRLFMQRFMYKKYVPELKNYVKSIMDLNLDGDLPDTEGGFNCGRKSGYIEDFDALSETEKQLWKSIRRTRVLFGTIKFDNAVDEKGEELDSSGAKGIPFIYEVESKTGFKAVGALVSTINEKEKLPPEFAVKLSSVEGAMNNGNKFYTPGFDIVKEGINIENDEDTATFSNFLQWVESTNSYVMDKHGGTNTKKPEKLDEPVEEAVIEEPVKKVAAKVKKVTPDKKELTAVLDNWTDD